jgi:hypothetical protein
MTGDLSYSVVYDEDGDPYILRSDGVGLSANVFDDMLELSKQNPEFFEHWISLMENYLFIAPAPQEA